MTNILPTLLNGASFDQTGLFFCQLFFYLVSRVNRSCTHTFATIKTFILWNQLIDGNTKVSSFISISLSKVGFSFRFNEGFRHCIVRYCSASLLRWHPWEESKLPVWPPSTVHGIPHLRLVTQNKEPVCQSFPKKTCPIVATRTKSKLNYPSRRWGLESTQNSMYRCLCVLLKDLHEAHSWEEPQQEVPMYFWTAI